MPKSRIIIHTVFNLEKDRQKQFNEDYELMFDVCEAAGYEDMPAQMKQIYEFIVENENKDGYVVLYEIQDEKNNIRIVFLKYMEKIKVGEGEK